MTLTKFMARSTWVAHAFGWEKLLKCHMKGKASKKLANGQNMDYSEKRKRPKGFICPCTGVKYHNIQTCLLVYAADSGERLQDHWSSGFMKHCAHVALFSFFSLVFNGTRVCNGIAAYTKPDLAASTCALNEKVQVGKDQEKAQSEKDSHSKNRDGKKPN